MFFAVDIDGVLARDTNGYARYLNNYFSLGITDEKIGQLQNYQEFTKLLEVKAYIRQSEETCAQFNTVAREAQYLSEIQHAKIPMPGSREAMEVIAKHYPFYYVTCRKSVTSATTHAWLTRNGFPSPDRVHYCERGIYEKYVIAHRLAEPGESILLIDDLALKLMKSFATVIKLDRTLASDLIRRVGLLAFGHADAPVWPFPRRPFHVEPLPDWEHFYELIGTKRLSA